MDHPLLQLLMFTAIWILLMEDGWLYKEIKETEKGHFIRHGKNLKRDLEISMETRCGMGLNH